MQSSFQVLGLFGQVKKIPQVDSCAIPKPRSWGRRPEKAAKVADEDQKTSRISSVNCPKWECQEIVKTVKSLGSTNLKLHNQIKMLEKRLAASDSESLKKDKMKMYLSDCSMFGPTQVRCLANGSTKGRGWTAEETSVLT
jgi:hypothetical protein